MANTPSAYRDDESMVGSDKPFDLYQVRPTMETEYGVDFLTATDELDEYADQVQWTVYGFRTMPEDLSTVTENEEVGAVALGDWFTHEDAMRIARALGATGRVPVYDLTPTE